MPSEQTAASATAAYVVHPIISAQNAREPTASLDEAMGLANAINLNITRQAIMRVAKTVPATLFGSGQVARLKDEIAADKIQLLIVNHSLTPGQQRNLEKALHCKVIDRTGLILEIFGERARTREGQLQVELAALNYQRSRLVRSWTHLERQRASGMGAGFLGGPGESQLELDRRLIDARIERIKEDLAEVRRTRSLQRRARDRRGQKLVALVGYTNAGKSTLFNALTTAEVLAKNMLFATLDPTLRRLDLGAGREVMLADTVGFIADLPTHLVEAFKATLEEVTAADLILHVRDAAHDDSAAQKSDVLAVLDALGIKETDERLVEVLNKADLLPVEQVDLMQQRVTNDLTLLPVSALHDAGLDELRQVIGDKLFERQRSYEILVPHAKGDAGAWLYTHGNVTAHELTEDGSLFSVTLSETVYEQYLRRFAAT